ncbi:MAG: tetratricopeptide repeat protein [Gammaproteobacteria bacterium]|nr:tetratricopeptide repeat protein [Gammaproteobacteria bacterium]
MPTDISELIQTGLEHHQSGRLQQAETIYRTILRDQPQHPDALHLLGVVALQVGKSEDAATLIESAIKARPDEPEFYNMCGEAYRALQKYDVAIARYQQALAIKPDFAGAHNNLGNAFKETGRLEEAIACYKQAIAISPDFPLSHNNLGIALKDLGRAEEAIGHYRQALAIAPDYAEAHTNLGNAFVELGRLEEGIACHEKALAIRPDYAEAHSNLGNAVKEHAGPKEALDHYKQAIAIRPDFATAHYNLGIALDELSRPDEAISHYEQALAIKSDYAEAHHNLGNALNEVGRREDAVGHYEQALGIKPDYAEAYRNLSRIKPEQEQVSLIEHQLQAPALSETDAMHYQFALGNIFHDAKIYDKAFQHYTEANSLKRKAITYDAKTFTVYVDRLIAAYSKEYFEGIGASGSDAELPVFVVGMPRSGTTLVEQIIASHPQVHGAGELASFGRYEKAIHEQYKASKSYPECMPLCYEAIAPELSKQYLEELRSYSHEAKRITDKMPDNFMRVGLIKTLFPNARIIHCQRNALDTCTSNYLHYFATGNEYSFDLRELGQFYLDYERLMGHWASLFGAEIFAVQYEELVMAQEKVSRQLIERMGLEWDDRCLEFHKNKRAINPFSSMQVRQPIYTESANRWKHYEKELAPLIAILPHATGGLSS